MGDVAAADDPDPEALGAGHGVLITDSVGICPLQAAHDSTERSHD